VKEAAFERGHAAGPYVAAQLRELDAALAFAIARVVGHLDDEAIHDLRVAIRRIRTLLKMARPLFGRFHADAVRKAFADVMRATGELRDEEVLEQTLDGLSERPAFVEWRRARGAHQKKLRRAASAAVEHGELDRARLMLRALLVFPFDASRNAPLSKFARRTATRARRMLERNRGVKLDDTKGLHDLRIAYKELQYSVELLAEALPQNARALREPATIIQKRLGEIHDADVAIQTLQKARGLPPREKREAVAALATLRTKRVSKYLADLDRLGKRFPASASDTLLVHFRNDREVEPDSE
jgi:CHAD domain-containing protein